MTRQPAVTPSSTLFLSLLEALLKRSFELLLHRYFTFGQSRRLDF